MYKKNFSKLTLHISYANNVYSAVRNDNNIIVCI